MSTAPLTASAEPQVREEQASDRLRITTAVALSVALGVLGLFAIRSTCSALWAMWMNDPLKSIGALIPIVSIILILRVWRSLGWTLRGSWWGLAVLAATIAMVHVRDQAVIELVLSPSWTIVLPPHSLVAVAYTAGFVLLFGGVSLLRAAWFPVALMWFVNPVPHVFNRYIDLPLQHVSAMVARSFAHALGQALTPDQLSLMFTPKFGMFIAPGCNGIRGAVAMGFIALIAGYLYRLRACQWALLTLAAVLLAYVFNFVRLCGLVFYYVLALRFPWLQDHAAMGDYILGACLFFSATLLLFAALSRWSPQCNLRLPRLAHSNPFVAPISRVPSLIFRCGAFMLLITMGSVSYARAMLRPASSSSAFVRGTGVFPQQVGTYKLQREWNESLMTGPILFHWAEYIQGSGNPVVAIGVSPTLGAHDTLICHAARGENWIWHGPLNLLTPDGIVPVSASLFNDGATQYLEAATVCTGAVCSETATDRTRFGLIYSRPAAHDLLTQNPARPIPILLRAETPDATLSTAQARKELTQSLSQFLSGADLAAFTKQYRQH
ncbi:MAG TPA: exosortase J [Acidobacteriaceae bacterium]|nr:exosortase J [Acidobacteriaceae bacterium]